MNCVQCSEGRHIKVFLTASWKPQQWTSDALNGQLLKAPRPPGWIRLVVCLRQCPTLKGHTEISEETECQDTPLSLSLLSFPSMVIHLDPCTGLDIRGLHIPAGGLSLVVTNGLSYMSAQGPCEPFGAGMQPLRAGSELLAHLDPLQSGWGQDVGKPTIPLFLQFPVRLVT